MDEQLPLRHTLRSDGSSPPQRRTALVQRVLAALVAFAVLGMVAGTEELVARSSTVWRTAVSLASQRSTSMHLPPPAQHEVVSHWVHDERAANWTPVAGDSTFAVRDTGASHAAVTWHSQRFAMRSGAFDSTLSRDRGIVIALHDAAFALGLSLVTELRCLGNQELVQIYYCTEDDLSLDHRRILVDHDNRLEAIDVCGDLVDAGRFDAAMATRFKNWWVKPLAMYHTNLRHALLLDADDLLLQDPAILRNTTQYRTTGTLFFYDRVAQCPHFLNRQSAGQQTLQYMLRAFRYTSFGLRGIAPSPRVLDSFAFHGRSCHEMDSSMVAIDKARAGRSMDVLWWLVTELRLRLGFSWGDKESFWLAYELAQQPYAFSQWGVSVLSSSTNNDMRDHPDTLCGSIAQYVPSLSTTPELLYVNGRALLDPLTQGVHNKRPTPNILYNTNPTHVVPRQQRTAPAMKNTSSPLPFECLAGLGSTPLPDTFAASLYRRRRHYLDAVSGVHSHLSQCNL